MPRRILAYKTPDQVSGLLLWLKADSLSLNDGDTITTWSDSSGNGYDASGSGATPPAYTANVLNGKPVVRFSGSNGFQLSSGASANFSIGAYTIIAVAKRTSGTTVISKNTTSTGGAGRRKIQMTLGSSSMGLNSGGDGTAISTTATTSSFGLFAIVARGDSDHDLVANGTLTNSTTTLGDSTFNTALVEIGQAFSNGAERLTGDIAEIIMYSRAISSDQVIAIENYLYAKYNLGVNAVMDAALGGYPRSAAASRVPSPLISRSLLFNGTTDFVSSTLWTSATNNVSMGGWFKSNDYTQNRQTILSNGHGSTAGYALVLSGNSTTDGSIMLLNHLVAWNDTGYDIKDNNWHHIFMTRTSANLTKIYIDGIEIYSASPALGTPVTISYIGKDSPAAGWFKGYLKDMRFYTTALTAREVQQLYSTPTFPTNAPTNHYRFNEGAGTVAKDIGSAPKNGTISGATYSTTVPYVEVKTLVAGGIVP